MINQVRSSKELQAIAIERGDMHANGLIKISDDDQPAEEEALDLYD